MITIGITGGIGSGKSTASQILGDLGAEVIDADQVGHKIYLPDTPAWREIVATFGAGVLAADRSIDRTRLGPMVFSDPESLAPTGLSLHPTQIYESLGNLVIFGVLQCLGIKKDRAGFITGVYLILYGVLRFSVEFLRGDDRGFYGTLSVSQWFSLAAGLAGLIILTKMCVSMGNCHE